MIILKNKKLSLYLYFGIIKRKSFIKTILASLFSINKYKVMSAWFEYDINILFINIIITKYIR